jgi:hypothetical protein
MMRENVQDLYSTHEEADSRMFYHLDYISAPSKVVIRTSDTDCLVIALAFKHLYNPLLEIWLEVGTQSNNSQRYININSLHAQLGESLCKSLLVYHALTGCDYTASFSRKGKVRPLKILEKDENLQTIFFQMGNQEELTEEVIDHLERFVCQMYSKNKCERVNGVRTDIFLNKYQTKDLSDRLSCVKKFDGSMMPPCKKI